MGRLGALEDHQLLGSGPSITWNSIENSLWILLGPRLCGRHLPRAGVHSLFNFVPSFISAGHLFPETKSKEELVSCTPTTRVSAALKIREYEDNSPLLSFVRRQIFPGLGDHFGDISGLQLLAIFPSDSLVFFCRKEHVRGLEPTGRLWGLLELGILFFGHGWNFK